MSIQLAYRSIKYPIGVCENLLVKISKFIFPLDFVVLEIDKDKLVPIILRRPFLTTARAVIDVHKGKLSLRVGSETVTFNIRKSMKSKHFLNHAGEWTEEEEGNDPNEVLAVSFYPRTQLVKPLEWKALKNQLKPSSVEPPKLKLKELPKHLEYAFLQENNQLLVVISSALSTVKKTRLLEVLRNHKRAITWSIADIKEISSSFCTHKIHMEDELKPTVQPQRRVNPNIKEEFDIEIHDKKGSKNLAADHLSRLESPDIGKPTRAEIRDLFPEEKLMEISDKNNKPCANYLASRVFNIWKAFGGNTRDLGSFGEEMDKTTDLHQHLLRISTQQLETASQITRDAVTIHTKMASQDLMTASQDLKTAS
uniref:Reverse transcriptase domain-containing protein n=1 Tax=Tanacetum cinerariifolium TaxID=118510 RepID=A0A6L2K1U4_TANCI|nr:hypothetical protein [Tanacetum cinerariifolium]